MHRARKRDHFARAVFVLILRGESTIDMERINSQLSLSCEKAITSVDPGRRRIDDRHGEDQQSTFTFASINDRLC